MFGLAPLLLVLAPVGPAPIPASEGTESQATTMLRLRDGGILWGEIVDHDSEGIAFLRLDNGGRVQLPWGFLDPALSQRLQLEHGYIEPQGEEILVTAQRIPVRDGDDVIGVIQPDSAPGTMAIKTAGGILALPLERVAGAATTVQVPALEIYTRDELYSQKLTELAASLRLDGEAGAAAHFAVGEFCERILDFRNALAHYEVGGSLAPEFRAAEIVAILDRLGEKAANQEQWEYLKDADLLRARRYYARALAKLELFPQLYPESPVISDWERLRAKTLKGQHRALRDKVAQRWHYWAQRHAHRVARALPFEEAVAWVEGEMGAEIIASVQADVAEIAPDISTEDVRLLWEERERGRVRTASFGHGSWLLGEDRARALPDDEPDKATVGATQDNLRADLRERMNRYVEAQRRAARRQQNDGEEPQAFWDRSSVNQRRQWITAYYAEFAGDMHIVRIRLSNCRECGGTGAREVGYLGSAKTQDTRGEGRSTNSGARLIECPTCQRVGVVRRVQYR